ncbi:TetR/AcrR family transcriptional regulator [Bacillus taeanensis]|uniref:TetR family transcriptional regulator n=1 Tax=Bacillus taeanensis TaxID=273032 RepID=A0A366XTC2_9BACI|nr:TetR/AcrR family transcriptional regulator [Bacillus taeanensis]RBW68395.1 TetR family transcriptional regulator [Bacillus taeanensis]
MSNQKQEAIFEAAMQLFAERGYDGTTVPMIADKAKVGAGTIYRYFENKESLVNSLFTKCVLQFSEAIRSNFPSETNVREKFTHIFNRLFEFARHNVNAFRFINSHHEGHYLNESSKKTFNDFLDFIIELIEDGKERGVIRSLPSCALIALVYEPIVKLVQLMETGELTYTEELVKELEESFWNAIGIS